MNTAYKVLAYLRDNQHRSFTARQIARAARVSETTARRWLRKLEDANEVIRDLDLGDNDQALNTYRYCGE